MLGKISQGWPIARFCSSRGERMRIAMFSETFLPGTDGVVTRLCGVLPRITEAGHDVLLIAPAGAPDEYAGVRIIGVPTFRFFLYPEKPFARPWPRGLGRRLRDFKPDLIHAVNPGFLAFAAIYHAKRLRVPLVMSYHTHIPTYARYYGLPWMEPLLWYGFRTVHNRAVINLCPSSTTAEELKRRGFRNVHLWARGVDVSLFNPRRRSDTWRESILQDGGSKVLLYVGRLAPEKGIERLRPCLDAFPDVHLVIVGDGPHRAVLEQTFQGCNVTFTGYLFGEELATAYASADGFVFPSTTETLGLVVLEALASGLPVAAAASPAMQEVLENGRIGLLFDPADETQLIRTVDKLLHDEDWRHQAQLRAREAAEQWDWSGAAHQLLEYYAMALHCPQAEEKRTVVV
jgi:glycosyltransferase involved in cell wall biosynthesis